MRSLLPLVLCSLLPLAAQTPSASVIGRVTDPSGAVVPAVAIQVTNLETNQTHRGVSNGAGDFTVPYLNPGRYTLDATARGFSTYRHADFKLEVDQELRLDIKL